VVVVAAVRAVVVAAITAVAEAAIAGKLQKSKFL